jgi:hypothetical protein
MSSMNFLTTVFLFHDMSLIRYFFLDSEKFSHQGLRAYDLILKV